MVSLSFGSGVWSNEWSEGGEGDVGMWAQSPEYGGYFLLLRGIAKGQRVEWPCGPGMEDPYNLPLDLLGSFGIPFLLGALLGWLCKSGMWKAEHDLVV